MAKWHINKNGVPAPCKAKEGNCPLGGSEQHFEAKEDAQSYINKKFPEEYGIMQELHREEDDYPESSKKIWDLLERYPERKVFDYVINAIGADGVKKSSEDIIEAFQLENYVDKNDSDYQKIYEIKNELGTNITLLFIRENMGDEKMMKVLESVEEHFKSEELPEPLPTKERIKNLSDKFGNEHIFRKLSEDFNGEDMAEFVELNSKRYNFKVETDFYQSPREQFLEIAERIERIQPSLSIEQLRDFSTEEQFEKMLSNAETRIEDIMQLSNKNIPARKIRKAFDNHPEFQVLDYFANAIGEDKLEEYTEYAINEMGIEDNFDKNSHPYLKFIKISIQFTPEKVLNTMNDFLGEEEFMKKLDSVTEYLDNERTMDSDDY